MAESKLSPAAKTYIGIGATVVFVILGVLGYGGAKEAICGVPEVAVSE